MVRCDSSAIVSVPPLPRVVEKKDVAVGEGSTTMLVCVGVGLSVGVGATIGISVGVGVGIDVGDDVGVGVDVLVGVGVDVEMEASGCIIGCRSGVIDTTMRTKPNITTTIRCHRSSGSLTLISISFIFTPFISSFLPRIPYRKRPVPKIAKIT